MSLTKRVFWRPTAQSLLDDCAHRGHTSCGKSLQKVITKVEAAPMASTAFPPFRLAVQLYLESTDSIEACSSLVKCSIAEPRKI